MFETWDAWLKFRCEGAYWKIDLLMKIAKLLRLKVTLYSGGTGHAEIDAEIARTFCTSE